MTDTTASSPLTEPPFELEDSRVLFARGVATGGLIVAAVRPDQLDGPTPCTDYDVRGLLQHTVMVLRRVAAIGRGEHPFSVIEEVDVTDDAWSQAWTDAAHQVQTAWTNDAALTRMVTLPWVEGTGGSVLLGYLNELTVHTWDLATATGQQPAWDHDVVRAAFAAIRETLPAEGRAERFGEVRDQMPDPTQWSDPFAPAVDVAANAPLIDQLVAWNGRRP